MLTVTSWSELASKIAELANKIKAMKDENQELKKENTELQLQIKMLREALAGKIKLKKVPE